MSAADVQVSEKFIACLKAGDIDGAVAQMTEDVVLIEAGGVPHAGTYHGHAGVYELIGRIGELFGGFELTDDSAYDAGEFVVGHMTGTFIARSGGGRISMPVVELYRIREGKLCHADVYYKDPSLFTQLGF